MVKKLISHDRMGCEHDKLVTLNHGGMRIRRIGRADDRSPVVPDSVLRRLAADLMLLQKLLNDIGERLSVTPLRARRILRANSAEIPNEPFGKFAELMGFFFLGHRLPVRSAVES